MQSPPWWLPENWLVVALAILGGVVLVQCWKLHCRHQYGRKPPRYLIASVSVVVTCSLITLLGWLDEQPIRQAMRTGLMWGLPSPILWLAIQWAIRRHAPGLADALGEDRRGPRTDQTEWSEEKRERSRRGLFEDTQEMPAVDKKKLNGQDGFASLTLIVGVVGALLVGALVVQSLRLSNTQEALGMERVAKKLALARIEVLGQEKRAAEASLKERDDGHDQIAKRRAQSGRELREVSSEVDCPVPDSARVVLRNRRGGHAESSPAPNPSKRVPASNQRPGDDA